MRLASVFFVLLAACTFEPDRPADPDDVFGPFTGPEHRFVVDDIDFSGDPDPGADLDGDGTIDNMLGQVLATFASEALGITTAHGGDMIGAGWIASTVFLQADDLGNDEAVGLRYIGDAGAEVVTLGGRLEAGAFRSNRTATTAAPGFAVVRVPSLRDADPIDLPMHGFAVELQPDGEGGYDGMARGAIWHADVVAAVHASLRQMVAANPGANRTLIDFDNVALSFYVLDDDLELTNFTASLLAPETSLYDGEAYWPGRQLDRQPDMVSFAFTFHLRPCPAGNCALAEVDTCFDRLLDGDETAIDCGGSCQPCGAGSACAQDADCWTDCDDGTCTAPTCDDGLQDGFESDVDCGAACSACGAGQRCDRDSDCAAGVCAAGVCP